MPQKRKCPMQIVRSSTLLQSPTPVYANNQATTATVSTSNFTQLNFQHVAAVQQL
jgi:hypothetical protein